MEGALRPGHFAGVATVVSKLLLMAMPDRAYFGEKDYQQLQVIKRMVRDLSMPFEIVGMPTVREPDGLAMSSRNRYLSAGDRERALGLSRGLRAAEAAWNTGEHSAERLAAITRDHVAACMDRIDYVAAVDPDTLLPPTGATERLVVLIAAHLGTTRLIDNLELC